MRTFTCPDCGHETAYDPKDCWAKVWFSLEAWRVVKEAYRLVRCAGLRAGARNPGGAGAKTRKASLHEEPATRGSTRYRASLLPRPHGIGPRAYWCEEKPREHT